MATQEPAAVNPLDKKPEKFPYSDADKARLADYEYFRKLFDGAHFEAFKIRVSNKDFNDAYGKLRYLYVNFAGLISKLTADMLFGEPVKPRMDNPDQQAWVEDFWRENNFDLTLYESELTASSQGDVLLNLWTDKRQPEDTKNSVFIGTTPPNIYFPHVNPFNVTGDPKVKELAWVFMLGKEQYLRRQIHEIGKIRNEIWSLKGDKLDALQSALLTSLGISNEQATGINRHLLVHIPNWRTADRWNGYSDYYDLDSLFFAINNRISKIDNVLDKHTDPILMVPPGVIGEDGRVKKDGRVIEIKEGEKGKPEYIVWDASLENAFKQIEKIVEFIYMIGEVSPDVLGLGQGVSDSGRALKYKLIRTIAKVNRKKLYYDRAIKEAIYVAQLLSKNGAVVNGKEFPGNPTMPSLDWQDGLPVDDSEYIDTIQKELDAGVTSTQDAIAKYHRIDESEAKDKLKEIEDENAAKMPEPLDPNRNPFTKSSDNPPPAK